LSLEGFPVEVFDKGRGAGGRASTRREGNRRFDHGAQYFTAKDERFKREVDTWIEEGVAAEWTGRIAVLDGGKVSYKERHLERFVGVPGMNSIVKRLAESATVRFGIRVSRLDRVDGGWNLVDGSDSDISKFDIVLLSLPPEQALSLLEGVGSPLSDRVRPVRSDACWAVLASFDERLPIDFDGAFVEDSPVAWIARDSSKPGRSPGERWVFHATPEWSAQHIEEDGSKIAGELLQSFFEATGTTPVSPEFVGAHRWRFAKVEEPLGDGCLWDNEWNVGVCGDWCHRCRVEGAFLSGLAIAERVMADVGERKDSKP
jgi:predicted NAD/FAD-dependent oxidoreductase